MMKSVLRNILLTILMMDASLVWAQRATDTGVLSPRVGALVDAQFGVTRCPGLSVAAAVNGEIIFSRAYGMADLEQGVPLTTHSAHRLASLSKPVTGTIIMEFVQEGKLILDDSVRKYVPELPGSYQNVTIRHLLAHQAGVRAYRDLEEVFSIVHYPTSRDALRTFITDPLLFPPGTRTEYSTYGFTLLGAVAEAVGERSFQDISADFFSRHRIVGFSFDDSFSLVPNRVRGYRVDEEGTVWNARAYDASNKYPAGGFTASAEDFLTFVLLVASSKTIGAEMVREMWSPQALADGARTPFGLGWGVGTLRGNPMVGFNGLQPGSQTLMRFFPEGGVGVVLACNAEGGRDLDGLIGNILDVILPTRD